MGDEIDTKTNAHYSNIRIKWEPNVYEMSREGSLTETESSERYQDNQASDGSSHYKGAIQFSEAAKSFQNVNVEIKEEPNVYDTCSTYRSNETEARDQHSDHQSDNSREEVEHEHPGTSCLDRYGTNYAVCIKYEPNSYEVRKSCMKSESGMNIGKTNDIDGTPDNSHSNENGSHDSDDILKRDVQHSCDAWRNTSLISRKQVLTILHLAKTLPQV